MYSVYLRNRIITMSEITFIKPRTVFSLGCLSLDPLCSLDSFESVDFLGSFEQNYDLIQMRIVCLPQLLQYTKLGVKEKDVMGLFSDLG